MRALLCTVGSRGDIQPMIVLGLELSRRGHQVRIAAPPNFRSSIEAQGLEFLAIGADTERLIEENKKLSGRNPLLVLPGQIALLRRETAQQLRDLFAHDRAVDLVVGAGLAFSGCLYAEKYAKAYAYVCYTLAGIRSREHPPAPVPIFGLPGWANALAWIVVSGLFDLALGGVLARARHREGLSPDPSPWRSIHAAVTVLAQDSILGRAPHDARGVHRQVPALVRTGTDSEPLPPYIDEFLRKERAPSVYLGFGSMPAEERDQLARAAVDLRRATGARTLLFSPGREPGRLLSEGVLAIGSVDHAQLFPRMNLVVHHGGAGTTATALRAGAPQWIVPHIVDQFFHGRRIAELGLGPAPVPKSRFGSDPLLRAFTEREHFTDRARAVATELLGSDGARAASEFLEHLLETRPQSKPEAVRPTRTLK